MVGWFGEGGAVGAFFDLLEEFLESECFLLMRFREVLVGSFIIFIYNLINIQIDSLLHQLDYIGLFQILHKLLSIFILAGCKSSSYFCCQIIT